MSLISDLFRRRHTLDLEGFTDWHCHILPGVDDGVRQMDDALAILDGYGHAGIRKVWLTPHIMEDIPNTTADLRDRFDQLCQNYNGPVELRLAAENMIDNLFIKRLEANDLLPIGDEGNTLLIETSYFTAPINFNEVIDAVKSKGYFPLLAHPERYNYIDSIADYRKMYDWGVRFQLNLMSLSGHYGPVVRAKAQRLLEEGMYSRTGTDLHRHEHLNIIRGIRLPRTTLDSIKLT